MSMEKTEALVIRMVDFSNTSKVATLFTRDFGKIGVIAKGARRLRSAFDAALDLLSVCNIVFIRNSSAGLDILTEAQLVTRFKPAPGKLSHLYAGYYVAELLDGLSEEHDSHPRLFQEAVETLHRLTGETPFVVSVLHFELVLLQEIGQLPTFEVCIDCGEPIHPRQNYHFKVTLGGFVCPRCLQGDSGYRQVGGDCLNALQNLSMEGDLDLAHLSLTPPLLAQAQATTATAISQILGRRPKMLRYLMH
jgi:DNA repair protein RecO (recombination protein O)